MNHWQLYCALISVAALLLLRRSPILALPAVFLTLGFAVSGWLGPHIWNLSASTGRTGIPIYRNFDEAVTTDVAGIFLAASLGPLLVASVVVAAHKSAPRVVAKGDVSIKQRAFGLIANVSPSLLLLLSTVMLAAWSLGQGSTLLQSSKYLSASGPVTLQHLSNPLVPVALLAGFFSALSARLQHGRSWKLLFGSSLFVLVLWWIALTAKGTRQSAAVPLLIGALLFVSFSRGSGLLKTMISTGFGWISLVTLSVAIQVRQRPGGILNLPTLVFSNDTPWPVGNASIWDVFAFIGKNLSGFVLVTGMSVERAPSSDFLVDNMNPLPRGLGGGAESYNRERLWPYEWVPLSSLGELMGALGPVGVISITSLLAIVLTIAATAIPGSRLSSALSVAALALTPLIFLMLVQYSSRNCFRVMWLAVLVAAVQTLLRVNAKLGARRGFQSRVCQINGVAGSGSTGRP